MFTYFQQLQINPSYVVHFLPLTHNVSSFVAETEGIAFVVCQELHNYELSPRSHLRVSFTQTTIRD